MTEHDLKEMKNLGAELGAAKAENERLRGLLERIRTTCCQVRDAQDLDTAPGLSAAESLHEQNEKLDAALSQQAEPVRCPGTEDTASMDSDSAQEQYTAVDMATAAAQGFRDGQAAVDPATAQDERKTFEVEIPDISAIYDGRSFIPYRSLEAGERLMTVAQHLRIEKQLRAALTRPAQTEQQPICHVSEETFSSDGTSDIITCNLPIGMALYAAPIEQTAPQGKFAMHQRVRKTTGSEWQGRICGTYSTSLTPEGYAVESEAHRGSVQIYPAKALEAVR